MLHTIARCSFIDHINCTLCLPLLPATCIGRSLDRHHRGPITHLCVPLFLPISRNLKILCFSVSFGGGKWYFNNLLFACLCQFGIRRWGDGREHSIRLDLDGTGVVEVGAIFRQTVTISPPPQLSPLLESWYRGVTPSFSVKDEILDNFSSRSSRSHHATKEAKPE